MKIRISNFDILGIILFIGLDFLYLVDVDGTYIGGLALTDIGILFTAFLGILLWIKYIRLSNYDYVFGGLCIVGLILVVTSAMQSHFIYGQSIAQGIIPQREFILWLILYFPVSKLAAKKRLTIDSIEKWICILGTAELILFITQYLLGSTVTFLHVNMVENARYEQDRYYYLPLLLDLLFFIKLDDFINNRKRIKSAVYIAAILFEVMVVQKFRLTTAGLLLTAALVILMEKGVSRKKIMLIFGALVVGYVLSQTAIVQDIFYSIQNGDANLSIRSAGRAFYLSVLASHPIFGGGYPNTTNNLAKVYAGITQNFMLVDNGIFGFAYMYGTVGVVWVGVIWYKMIKSGLKIRRYIPGKNYLLAFVVFALTTMIQELHWYWQNGFMILVIFWVLLECYSREVDAINRLNLQE